MKPVLFAWLGHTDIRCSQGKEAGLGPIGQAASERGFQAIELISNDAAGVCNAYVDWLQNLTSAEINVHKATLSSPMNFGEIYETADRVVDDCMERGAKQLVFHLSPGTSAMTAMWLVLATTKYNAELIASSVSTGVYTPDFPFEIAADYLPRRRSAVKGKHVRELFEDRTPPAFDNIVHRCDAMKRVIDRAQRVAGFDVPVMILGETGTGKELFAEAIHHASPRAGAPWRPLNCGAFPKELVDSELFGHRKGAFTGADSDRIGILEQADGGTVFLDEVGELPLEVQVKLLRVLQQGTICPIGSRNVERDTKSIDVRIISATLRDLPSMIVSGTFREDLYHRLAVGVLTLPPLRQRPGDLALLIEFQMDQLKKRNTLGSGVVLPRISAGARSLLNQHPWRGNIRELFNVLTRAVIWTNGSTIEKSDLEGVMEDSFTCATGRTSFDRDLEAGFSLPDYLKEIETHFIRKAMESTRNHAAAARLLGFNSGPALRYRLEALGIKTNK